jgi:hypothetical protein
MHDALRRIDGVTALRHLTKIRIPLVSGVHLAAAAI